MYDFFDRLVNIAFTPRARLPWCDKQCLSMGVGLYLGCEEQVIFPSTMTSGAYQRVPITVVTQQDDAEGRELRGFLACHSEAKLEKKKGVWQKNHSS